MSNVQARGGSVRVRVGGNTQDTATLEPSLADGKMMEKQSQDTANPVRFSSQRHARRLPAQPVDPYSRVAIHAGCSLYACEYFFAGQRRMVSR